MRKLSIKNLKSWSIWKKYNHTEWIFLTMGIIAIFVAVTSLFTSLGDRTPNPAAYFPKPTTFSDPEFEKTIEGTVNHTFKGGGNVKIIRGGDAFMTDLLEEIENASSSINITNYIWDDGDYGDLLLTALIKKAKEGIEVRILLDGLGGRKSDEKLRKELEKEGGKISIFRPITLGQLTRIHRRTHVRAFIIDGKTAYTGGVAISDSWFKREKTPDFWHDFMFKVEGEMAIETQKIFATLWSETSGEILHGVEFYPSATSTSTSRFISIWSAPSPDLNQRLEHFLWYSIRSASSSIQIENPYLVLNQPLIDILKEKARNGVKVEIILPGKHTDQKIVQWTSQSYYKELIDAGIQIYEYEPSRIHSKFMVIDGEWSIIGSANLDNRSRQLNVESLLGIYDKELGADLNSEFEEDKANSLKVNISEWKKRVVFLKMISVVTKFFIKQY